MAKVLNASQVIDAVVHLLDSSNECVCLISPYWYFPSVLLEAIKNAANRQVDVFIIFRDINKEKYKSRVFDVSQYNELKRDFPDKIHECYCDKLHAKCYFNENACVISSMNLSEGSLKNFELGISFNWESDKDVMISIMREVNNILLNLGNFKFDMFNTYIKRASLV